MRIDAHQHYWRYDAQALDWIGPGMEALARDWLPQDFAPLRDQGRIDAGIAVQARGSEAETEFLMEQAAANDWIAGVVGWIDLAGADVPARIAHWRARGPLVGLRHQVQDEADPKALLEGRAFNRGVAQVQEAGLVYELLLLGGQLDAAAAFCAAHDAHHLVLDHLGKPDISGGQDALAAWRGQMRALARMPHVSVKLSGLVTEAGRDRDGAMDVAGIGHHLDLALELFGSQRLLFGSDWPVCLLAAPWPDVVGIVESWARERLNASEYRALFGGNAITLYGNGLRLAQSTCNTETTWIWN